MFDAFVYYSSVIVCYVTNTVDLMIDFVLVTFAQIIQFGSFLGFFLAYHYTHECVHTLATM